MEQKENKCSNCQEAMKGNLIMYCSCNETFCSLNCMYKWHKLKPINTSCIAESKQLGLMGLNYKIRKKT